MPSWTRATARTIRCARSPNACRGRCAFSASARIGLITDFCVFTILIGYAPRPLLMRLVSLAAATLVTWRLNRALTFDRSRPPSGREAVRYAVVTAAAQGTSYAVFAALVLTVLGCAAAGRAADRRRRSARSSPTTATGCSPSRREDHARCSHARMPTSSSSAPGPAGLTAAYCLTKENPSVIVIEKDPVYVGGISRTVEYNGFMFDIGGHRFFSKAKEVVDLWQEILPDDFIERPRLSRIYYGGKYYSYPLSAFEALRNLGLFTSAACMLSFAYAKAFPIKEPRNFHEWVRNQFGEKLFSIFFKTYTEKVWGMSCDEISADWAAQRIKGLDLGVAVIERAEEGAAAASAQAEGRRAGGQDADRELPVSAPGAPA